MKPFDNIVQDLSSSSKDHVFIKRPMHLKSRLVISLILLIFSIVGIFVTEFSPAMAWYYWMVMVPLFAALSVWLNWYVSKHHEISSSLVWREILHWIGLLFAVYIVSAAVHNGFLSYLNGGLVVLVLLALTLFLAGVHFDWVFMSIGFVLGLLGLMAVYFIKYVAIIVLPVAILIGLILILGFISHRKEQI